MMNRSELKEFIKEFKSLLTDLAKTPFVDGELKFFPKRVRLNYKKLLTTLRNEFSEDELVMQLPKRLPNIVRNSGAYAGVMYFLSPFILAYIFYFFEIDKDWILPLGLYYPGFILTYRLYRLSMRHKQKESAHTLRRIFDNVKKSRPK